MRIQSPRALNKTNNPHQCDNPPDGKDHAASVCARRRPCATTTTFEAKCATQREGKMSANRTAQALPQHCDACTITILLERLSGDIKKRDRECDIKRPAQREPAAAATRPRVQLRPNAADMRLRGRGRRCGSGRRGSSEIQHHQEALPPDWLSPPYAERRVGRRDRVRLASEKRTVASLRRARAATALC